LLDLFALVNGFFVAIFIMDAMPFLLMLTCIASLLADTLLTSEPTRLESITADTPYAQQRQRALRSIWVNGKS
jgi:hypothetical protein